MTPIGASAEGDLRFRAGRSWHPPTGTAQTHWSAGWTTGRPLSAT